MAIAEAGIPVRVNFHPRIARNKVIVIDHAEVETGSLNWMVSADLHDAENLLFLRDPSLAAAYEGKFEGGLQVSETLDEYEAAHAR